MSVNRASVTLGLIFLFVSGGIIAAAAEDVTGTWDIKVETAQGTATPSVTLRQQGEKLAGTYKGRMGESALEGTIKGDQIQFSVKLKFQEQEFVVRYTGKVEGEAMSGTVQFGNSRSAKWTARRKPATNN